MNRNNLRQLIAALLLIAWPLWGCSPENPARPANTAATSAVATPRLPDRVTQVTYSIGGSTQTQRFILPGVQLAAADAGGADVVLHLDRNDNILRREGAGAAVFSPHNGRFPEGPLTDVGAWQQRYVVTGAGANDGTFDKSCTSSRVEERRWRIRCTISRVGTGTASSRDEIEVVVTPSGQRVIVGGNAGGRSVQLVAAR
jgi:hypothetical protein